MRIDENLVLMIASAPLTAAPYRTKKSHFLTRWLFSGGKPDCSGLVCRPAAPPFLKDAFLIEELFEAGQKRGVFLDAIHYAAMVGCIKFTINNGLKIPVGYSIVSALGHFAPLHLTFPHAYVSTTLFMQKGS